MSCEHLYVACNGQRHRKLVQSARILHSKASEHTAHCTAVTAVRYASGRANPAEACDVVGSQLHVERCALAAKLLSYLPPQ